MTARLVPLAGLDGPLVRRWRDLASHALEPNPFADPDFVLPVAATLGARVSLAVVQDAGRLTFALPLVRSRTYRGMPMPAVTTWLHDYGCLGTPLVAPDAPESAWRQALALFDATAAMTALKLLPTDGPVFAALTAVLRREDRRSVLLGERLRPVVHRRPEPTYLDALSGDRRKTLRKRRRQLAQELGGDLRRIDHAHGDLDAAVTGLLAMEADGWKGRDGGAMARRPGHAELFRAVCAAFAARGRLQLWSLEASGRTAAYQCVLTAGDTMFLFKTTYDERLRRVGPGVTLITDVLDDFHDTGRYETVNSCTGLGESLTPQLLPDRQALAEVLVMPPGPVGGAAAWLTPRAAAAYRRLRHRRVPEPAGV